VSSAVRPRRLLKRKSSVAFAMPDRHIPTYTASRHSQQEQKQKRNGLGPMPLPLLAKSATACSIV
jgi:hypothetical protein